MLKPSLMTKTLISILTVFMLLFGIGYYFLTTDSGNRWLIDIAKPFIPGKLDYSSVQGNLFSTLTIKDINYQSSNFSAKASTLSLRITLEDLWPTKIKINDFNANKITLQHDKKTYTIQNANIIGTVTTSQANLQLAAKLLNGNLTGVALVEWDKPSWNVTLYGQQLNANALNPNIESAINFQAKSAGNLNQYTINIPTLNGKLNGFPVDAKLAATITGKKVTGIKLNLTAGKAHITANGDLAKQWQLNWSVNIPNLQTFLTDAQGTIISTGNLTGNADQPSLSADIALNHFQYNGISIKTASGKAKLNLFNQENSSVDIEAQSLVINQQAIPSITIKATGNQQTIQLNAQTTINKLPVHMALNSKTDNSGTNGEGKLIIADQPAIQLNFSLANYHWQQPPTANQKISATLKWQSKNLTALADLNQQITDPTGTINANLNLTGTIGKPIIAGNISLTDGSFKLPTRQITVTNISANANFDHSKIEYSANATSDGTIKLAGTTELNQELKTNMTVTGEHVLVSNTKELTLFLSPDLTITNNNKKINVTGDITIPKAQILPYDFSSTQTLTDDVVYVNDKSSAQTDKAWLVFININLIAGNDIKINVKGLSGKLTGKVSLSSEPDKPTMATGELTIVDGTYDAYGQTLTISQGNINYVNNPIQNPTLDVQATRSFKTNETTFSAAQQTLIVGVQIRGHVRKPKISLFSNPSGMSQADILSMLILGQPLQNAKPSSADVLLRAASALSPGGGGSISNVTNQIKQGLGLSTFGVETQSEYSDTSNSVTNNTALVLGKYLTPKLYIEYSLGLFNPVNILRVRYQLSKKWSVQTENSTIGTGGDILYTISRD